MEHTEFKPGQTVWVCHFNEYSRTHGKPTASISEREFYRYSVSTFRGSEGQPRIVLGPKGKAKFENTGAPYGIAYEPSKVYETREQARRALSERIDAHVSAVFHLKHEVCKP